MTMGTRLADGGPHVLNVRREGTIPALACLLVVASAALNTPALIVVDNMNVDRDLSAT